jgi:adenylate kinase family enzyme
MNFIMLKLCKMSFYLEILFMALKLYVFGLPGNGKSTIAHRIVAYLKDKNWESFHFSDHVILEEMFLADTEHKKFKPAEHGGFDVIDFVVCDIALQELERIINIHILYAQQEKLVLIEFARNDYRRTFQQFSARFLHDAYFLYLDVEANICKRRIQERIENPSSEDDFYVSEDIFNFYYNGDDGRSIPQILASDYGIEEQRVKVIDNNGSLSDSMAQVYKFVDTICGLKPLGDS